MNPTPIPGIECSPAVPPDRTAAPAGSTATVLTVGLRAFRTPPTPVIVPPVPTAETKTSTPPPVSSQISTAVVRRWTSGFAGFANWSSITASGSSATTSRARDTASVIKMPGVSTTSAPR